MYLKIQSPAPLALLQVLCDHVGLAAAVIAEKESISVTAESSFGQHCSGVLGIFSSF